MMLNKDEKMQVESARSKVSGLIDQITAGNPVATVDTLSEVLAVLMALTVKLPKG